MNRDVLICLLLATLTIILFAPARTHEFINYDDPRYVLEPMVQRGLTPGGVRWAFTTFNFANYHPITWISHMIDAQLFGADPAGHHLHSVLLHAINTVVLFLVLRLLTSAPWESSIVAALFAVHPLRVESVAWASERKDLLCVLFLLLSVGAYARWTRKRSYYAYAASLVTFALALMSKPMAVTLPIVLLLIDCWPLKRPTRWRILSEKVTFIAFSVASAIVTIIAQRQGGAMSESIYTPTLRAANAICSYARYLWLTIWPKGLAIFYPYEGALPGTTLPARNVILAAVVLIALTILAVLLWRRNRAVLVGWLWFVVTLVPTIGIVQVGQQAMADRYTYLPHIGLLIAIVFGVAHAVHSHRALRTAAASLAVMAIIALCVRTRDQLQYWRNDVALFSHALDVTANNHIAHSQLGMVLVNQRRLSEALAEYQKAIAIKPADAQPYYNVGVVLHRMGKLNEAKKWYVQALARSPQFPEALVGMGNALLEQRRELEAIEYYRKASQFGPDYFTARYNLGLSLAHQGQVAEALPEFAAAVRIQPQNAEARFSYGLALKQTGKADEAIEQFRRARELAMQQENAALLADIERQLSPPANIPTTSPTTSGSL